MADFTLGDFESCSFRFGWGLSPSDARITFPGRLGALGVSAGDPVSITVDGAKWFGVVAGYPKTEEFQTGSKIVLNCVDYRVRLMADVVFCVFNRMVVIEDDPLTPGVDRMRKFEHIGRDEWDRQNITRTREPMTVREIIEHILANGPSLKEVWRMEWHPDMEVRGLPVEVDASNGKKFGTLLADIATAMGLMFHIRTSDTLVHTIVWGRRGEGAMPAIDDLSRPSNQYDLAATWADTQIIVAGDRQLHQVMLTLEPDWRSAWEKYWLEAAWVARVNTVFGPFAADSEGQARLAAKAREVTVQEYVDLCGDYDEDPALFEDFRRWQDVGRMAMPAMLYLRDIVFKAYRIPLDTEVNGTRLDALEIHEGGLLADVEHDATTGAITYMAPMEYYPPTKAYVVVQGAEIERIFDPRLNKALTDEQLANARTTWVPNGRFQIDRKNKAIIFESAQILFGEGDDSLFLFPNRATVASGHPLYNVAVPNANAVIYAATVKACMVVEAGRYTKTFGDGDRTGVQYVSGLCDHILRDESGAILNPGGRVPFFQIDGADKTADDIARMVAENMLKLDAWAVRGYDRIVGRAGTALTGVIESIVVDVEFNTGISETITYSRERDAAAMIPRALLERNVRSGDLFNGQTELRNEARTLRAIADALAKPRKPALEGWAANAQEVMQRPVGAVNPGIRIVTGASSTAAGAPVFTRAHDDAVSESGEVFAGVATTAGGSGRIPVATQGTVPVLVRGPFTRGSTIGVRDGEGFARIAPDGHKTIGRVMADYTGTASVLAPCELGAAHSSLRPSRLEPWMAYVSSISETGGEATDIKLKLNPDSTLLLSDNLGDVYDFKTQLAKEYPVKYGECLWIEINFTSNGSLSSAIIKSGVPSSKGWSTWGAEKRKCWELLGYYPDDKSQTLWVMLASIDEAKENDPVVATFSSGPATLRTYRNTHLCITRKCADTAGRETIRWVEPASRAYQGVL